MRKYLPFLDLMQRLSPDDREIILPNLNSQAYSAITDCIRNAMLSSHISPEDKAVLKNSMKKQKDTFRGLINPNISENRRQKAIIQTGGSLNIILETILPLIAKLLF